MDSTAPKTIIFTALRITQALAYHLEQPQQPIWQYVDEITVESIQAYFEWLFFHDIEVEVSRWDWRHLTDAQRLEWLFTATAHEIMRYNGTRRAFIRRIEN